MAFKTLHQRVADAFGDARAEAFGDHYLDIILQTWREATVSLRRTGSLLAILIVAFLLLFNAKGSSVTLGPFEVNDLSAVLVLLPAVVAHLLYEFVALVVATDIYDRLRLQLVRHLYPSLERNDLEAAISPAAVSFWGQDPWRILRTRSPGKLATIEDAFTATILIAIVLGCTGFVVDSYVRLLSRSNVSDVELLLSALLALFSVIRTALVIVDWWRTTY